MKMRGISKELLTNTSGCGRGKLHKMKSKKVGEPKGQVPQYPSSGEPGMSFSRAGTLLHQPKSWSLLIHLGGWGWEWGMLADSWQNSRLSPSRVNPEKPLLSKTPFLGPDNHLRHVSFVLPGKESEFKELFFCFVQPQRR